MKKTFFQNSIISIAFYILSSIFSIIYSIYLGRSLGPEGLGYINFVILSLTTCNIILNFGLGQAIVFFFHSNKFHNDIVIVNSFIITIFVSFVSIILFFLSHKLVYLFFPNYPHLWIFVLFLISPFVHFKTLAEYYYAAIGNFYLNSGLNLFDILIRLFLSFLFFYFVSPTEAFFYAIVVSTILIGFVPWVKILSGIRVTKIIKNNLLHPDFFIPFLKYSLFSYFSVLIAYLSLRVDQIFIGSLINKYELGVYAVAVIFAELPFKVSNAITKVLFAKISANSLDKFELTSKTLRLILLVSIVFIFILILFGNSILIYLYGDRFLKSYNILLVLLPGSFFFNIIQILQSDLSGRGYPSFGIKSGFLILIISIIINLIIIPKLGIVGVAMVSSISYFLGSLLMIFYFLGISKLSLKDLLMYKKTDFNFSAYE